MKFFVFDLEGMATALAYRLKMEGNDVRFLSLKEDGKEHLKGMVEIVPNLKAGLNWINDEGYVICGDEMNVTKLRDLGFKTYGGNAFTERMEKERLFQNNIAKACGIKTSNAHEVESAEEAIEFIRDHPDQWVLKQMGHAPKTWNYVGKEKDGSDVIDQIEWMMKQPEFKKLAHDLPFMLQEVVDGLEFACSAFWMYDDWKRRDDGSIIVELNREHKKQGDGDTGLTTGEMGTVAQWSDNMKLFSQTLEKLTETLKEKASDVCINIDANCGIIEEDGEPQAYLYELTPREGYPSQALNLHLLDTEAGKFYSDLIEGLQGEVEHKKDWGVVTVLGSGQFPLELQTSTHEGSFKDQPVIIPQWQDGKYDADIAPFYIKFDKEKDFYRVADYYEYLLGVTKSGPDIMKSNSECVKNMEEIITRAPHFRHDIGTKFQEEELPILKELGYVD